MDLNSKLEKIDAIKGVATGLILNGGNFALVGDNEESLKAAFAIIHPTTVFKSSGCEQVLILKACHIPKPTKKNKS